MPATQTNHLAGGETTQLIVVLHEEVRVPDVHTLFKMGSKSGYFSSRLQSSFAFWSSIPSVLDNISTLIFNR